MTQRAKFMLISMLGIILLLGVVYFAKIDTLKGYLRSSKEFRHAKKINYIQKHNDEYVEDSDIRHYVENPDIINELGISTAVCGNGTPENSEECDDGNQSNGDGCTDTCLIERGYYCIYNDGQFHTVSTGCAKDARGIQIPNCSNNSVSWVTYSCPQSLACYANAAGADPYCDGVCGDGFGRGSEACDDGNSFSNDGCAYDCKDIEATYSCVGSPSFCTSSAVCGNRVIEGPEGCEDGNTLDRDGCSSRCLIEEGYSCYGNPSNCVRLSANAYVLEDDGTIYSGRYSSNNNAPTEAATRLFNARYPSNQYDFIVLLRTEGMPGGPPPNSYVINNDQRGIFAAPTSENNSKKLGSRGTLKAVASIAFTLYDQYVNRSLDNEPSTLIPSFYLELITHELTHYWGVRNLPQSLREAQTSFGHFPSLTGSFVSEGSYRSGGYYENAGNNFFVKGCAMEPRHDDFMLYSMGLKESSEIHRRLIIPAESYRILTSRCDSPIPVSQQSVSRVFSVQDFVNALGPRIPSVERAQKDFAIAFVLMTPRGRVPTQEEITALNWITDKYPTIWYKNTEGRSKINNQLPSDRIPPVISNINISNNTITLDTNEEAAVFVIYERDYQGTRNDELFDWNFIYPELFRVPPQYSRRHQITVPSYDAGYEARGHFTRFLKIIAIDQSYNMASSNL